MIERFVEHVGGDAACSETDKPESGCFYERFGFEAVQKAVILGVPNWFVWRRARRGA